MIGTLANLGWKWGLAAVLALAGITGSAVKGVQAHFAPNYAAVVTAPGPIVPGSFRIVDEVDTTAGHLVIYTVKRPDHPGSGLGAILTYQPNFLSRVTVDAGESDSVATGTIQFGTVRLADRNLVYGVTTPGTRALIADAPDTGDQIVSVDSRGGFFLYLPLKDAGAIFTPFAPHLPVTDAGVQLAPAGG